ncbi:hypothetical protein LCGC14_2800100 [marine sediment metagenome]|uniref:4Fe-4S ferredoxin-type domain-containing protein n=1 Tax=marine sediment metagenome TaxID=412755 RepID=A0A0F9BEB8_9ZZZZ
MRIKVDMNKCNGCRLCEAVCSTVSNIKEKSGILNPDISAIKINYDKFKRNDTAIVCYQCKKGHCMDICNTYFPEYNRMHVQNAIMLRLLGKE